MAGSVVVRAGVSHRGRSVDSTHGEAERLSVSDAEYGIDTLPSAEGQPGALRGVGQTHAGRCQQLLS